MSQTWVRVIAGLIAIAVVLVVGINVVGSIDLTPDPDTGVPVGFNTVIALLAPRPFSYGNSVGCPGRNRASSRRAKSTPIDQSGRA